MASKKSRLILGKNLSCECGEALQEVAQPSHGYSIPESVQDQTGQSFEQPDLVKYAPVHGKGTGINRVSAWKTLHLI